MKTFKKAPLALAITALLAAPYALAGEDEAEGFSAAKVGSLQINGGNTVNNDIVDNNATVDGNALRGASGNIGVNVAAGDNNQQANDAALAVSDADLVFSMASAKSLQAGVANGTTNAGVDNNANLGGNALRGASGNIGVNIASGNSNLQQNSLAASVSSSSSTVASAGGIQLALLNTTDNTHTEVTTETVAGVSLDVALISDGTSSYDQIGNVYPDTWGADTNDGEHESSPGTGHMDLDNQAQGAQDLNGDGGALAFKEASPLVLSGTVTGQIPATVTTTVAHNNSASLGGNALRGASGNIGVNIASGSNNMQRNSLALSASMGSGAN